MPPAGENTLTRPAAPVDLSHEGEVNAYVTLFGRWYHSGRKAGTCIAVCTLLLWSLGVHAAESPTISFQISDGLSEAQVDEEIAVSINHVPVGTLKVGPDKDHDMLKITVPASAKYRYDLCGHLNQRENGKMVTHRIDHGGELGDLDGHFLVAYNTNSTIFYLIDETPGKPAAIAGNMDMLHSCPNTVAMK